MAFLFVCGCHNLLSYLGLLVFSVGPLAIHRAIEGGCPWVVHPDVYLLTNIDFPQRILSSCITVISFISFHCPGACHCLSHSVPKSVLIP